MTPARAALRRSLLLALLAAPGVLPAQSPAVRRPAAPPPALPGSLPPRPAPTPPGWGGLPVREGYVPGADGVQLFLRIVGSGRDTVVLVHGGPGLGLDDGGLELEALAGRGFTMVLYDQRGGGRSELVRDSARLTLADHVADLEALRRRLRLSRTSLVGLSWGSAVAAHYAERHPGRVHRLVFLAPMPVAVVYDAARRARVIAALGPSRLDRLRSLYERIGGADDAELARLCREASALFAGVYVTDPAHLRRARGDDCTYSPDALRNRGLVGSAGIGSLGEWDFRPLLARVRAPVLVLEGARSVVPLDATREWARAVPGARLHLVPDAGHMPWLDRPEATLDAIASFLRR